MWAQIINTILGVWLIVAPSILRFEGWAENNCYVIGPLVITISYIAVWEVNRSLRFANLPLSVWLILSPLVIKFPLAALVNSLVLGFLVAAFSFIEGKKRHSYAGGWAVLWRKEGY